MKIGIMSFAHHHAESYIHNLRAIPGVEMIGIADEELARGRKFADRFDAHLFPSYEALLDSQPDGVLVCSENAHHRPLVEMAAQAGVHADAQAIVEVCRDAGVILMTAFPMRFSPPLLEVKKQIDTGALGKLFCFKTTNQGQMPAKHRSWFVDKTLAGGGALMDHVVHLADLLSWFLDSEVTEVYAQTNHILHADQVDVETGGLLMLTFANDVFATIDSSWSMPLNYPTWGGLTMALISERGLTAIDAFSQNLQIFQDQPANYMWDNWGSDANQALMTEFVAAIREDRQPLVTGEDGYRALEVVLAAYESAASGKVVYLQGKN
jgi:predicted dehydrogenase